MLFINKQPTKPGFYWIKGKTHVSIGKVIKGPRELELLIHGSKTRFPLSALIKTLQWAGPITIPNEGGNNKQQSKGANNGN